jgi:hypothetical protein
MVSKNKIWFVIGALTSFLFIHFCERKNITEKVITKTRVVKVTDTLRPKDKVVTKYKEVFVVKTDTSLVYLDKPNKDSKVARLYEQPIIGKRSSGVAKITTTGDLLDFSAIIECQNSIKETTITKYKNKSQLFLSPSYNTNNQMILGVDWNIKNKVLIKGGVGYDINNTSPYLSVGVGIPIF